MKNPQFPQNPEFASNPRNGSWRFSIALIGTLFVGANSVFGQSTYTWDVNQGTAGTGGTGIWSNSASTEGYWTADGSTFLFWPSVPADSNVLFGETPGAVSVTGQRTVNSMVFDVGGYSLLSSSPGATKTIDTTLINTVTGITTFSADIAIGGSTGFTKAGDGTLILNRSEDYTGATAISGGTLKAGTNNVLDFRSLDIASGATLDLAGFSQSTTSGTLSGTGTITSSQPGGQYAFGSTTSSNFSGVISGGISLSKDGGSSSTLTLSGNSGNSYTGATSVTNGNLELNKTAGNAITGSGLTIGDGSGTDRVILLRSNQIEDSMTVLVNSGARLNIGANTEVVGSIAGAGTVDLDAGGSFFFGGNGASTVFSGNLSAPLDATVTKQGTGKLTVQGSVTGGTIAITGGTLELQGGTASLGANNGNVTVSSVATLSGVGTVLSATTINGSHSVAGNGAAGTQTFSSSLTYGSGSIFAWDLDASGGAIAVDAADQGSYDKVSANGAVTGISKFEIALGGTGFADPFWNTNKSWTDIFTTGTGSSSLATIFTTFGGSGVDSLGSVADRGQFAFTGNTLQWSAVPEPSSALAGMLMLSGVLGRRRKKN